MPTAARRTILLLGATWFGAQSTKMGPSSAGADDAAYAQRKLVAALKVAQEGLATEKAKSDHDLMNR